MDNYQAVYDAVRSRISNCDVGSIVESAIGRPDIDSHFRAAANEIAYAMTLPSVIYRPKIYMDGDQWCARLGENIQEGVCGFGDTPEKAVSDFNKKWLWTKEQIAKAEAAK